MSRGEVDGFERDSLWVLYQTLVLGYQLASYLQINNNEADSYHIISRKWLSCTQ